MAWLADGAPCTYFGVPAERLVAIGWLDAPHPYPRGDVVAARLARLEAMIADERRAEPIVYRGKHACTLCPDGDEPEGHRNLFLPDGDRILIAPELIGHYVRDHGYAPPADLWRVLDDAEHAGARATKRAVWTRWDEIAPPRVPRRWALYRRDGNRLTDPIRITGERVIVHDTIMVLEGDRVLLTAPAGVARADGEPVLREELLPDDELELAGVTYTLLAH